MFKITYGFALVNITEKCILKRAILFVKISTKVAQKSKSDNEIATIYYFGF